MFISWKRAQWGSLIAVHQCLATTTYHTSMTVQDGTYELMIDFTHYMKKVYTGINVQFIA